MPNAVKARAAEGDRAPGLIDNSAVFATHFHFASAASLKFAGSPADAEFVDGPVMGDMGLAITNQFSVGLWVKWNETPNTFQGIANATSSWQGLNDGWGLYWSDNGFPEVTFFVNQWNGNFALATADDANAWNFMVGVYDGTLGSDNIKLYINGVVGATTDDFTGTVTQPAKVQLGQTANDMTAAVATDWAVGNLDELGLWNTALSSDAITTLYNNGAPTNLIVNSGDYMASGNLGLWWRCGEALDSNTQFGINDRSVFGNSNPGTMIAMEDEDIDTVDFAGA